MKRSIACALAALLLVLLVGCDAPSAPSPSAAPTASPAQTAQEDPDGRPVGVLSDFETRDLYGNAVDAQGVFTGWRLTMVNVWGTFCGPCIREMPELGELSDELAERNVRIIGLVSDAAGYHGAIDEEAVAAAQRIVEETGADYLHLIPSPDLSGLLAQISAVPTTFFVDENGCQVGKAYAGAKGKEDWAELVEETLALLEE